MSGLADVLPFHIQVTTTSMPLHVVDLASPLATHQRQLMAFTAIWAHPEIHSLAGVKLWAAVGEPSAVLIWSVM